MEIILTNDNKSTSPFLDMGGKICIWFMWMVSDLIVFLDDRIVFSADPVIENLEVELVDLRSEAVNY